MSAVAVACEGCKTEGGRGILRFSVYGGHDEPCVMCNPAHPAWLRRAERERIQAIRAKGGKICPICFCGYRRNKRCENCVP